MGKDRGGGTYTNRAKFFFWKIVRRPHFIGNLVLGLLWCAGSVDFSISEFFVLLGAGFS